MIKTQVTPQDGEYGYGNVRREMFWTVPYEASYEVVQPSGRRNWRGDVAIRSRVGKIDKALNGVHNFGACREINDKLGFFELTDLDGLDGHFVETRHSSQLFTSAA